MNFRLTKLRMLRWETGSVLPEKIRHDTLSTREKEYFTKYNEILTEYFDSTNLDLCADMEVVAVFTQHLFLHHLLTI